MAKDEEEPDVPIFPLFVPAMDGYWQVIVPRRSIVQCREERD